VKVRISFERPSGFVLELDSVQEAAWKKYQAAVDRAESFGWYTDSPEMDKAWAAVDSAFDDFQDSIHFTLENARMALVEDITEFPES